MSRWIERILNEFPADLAHLWIVADPDDMLLDEQILSSLRARGFEVLPFEDSVVFRAEYEERYRAVWDSGNAGPANSLILQLRGNNVNDLPWDYLRQARIVSLSLAHLFPQLSYGVVRQIGAEYLAALFDAQSKHVSQSLGEALTKDFILTHIFRIGVHFISRAEELWTELLRLHYRGDGLPPILSMHVAQVLGEQAAFKNLPIADLFSSKSKCLRIVQDAWYRYLAKRNVTGAKTAEPTPPDFVVKTEVPFDNSEVWVIVDSMFLEGTLHPLVVQGLLVDLPDWAKVGIVQDPYAMRNLVQEGIKNLIQTLPTQDSSYRNWMQMSRHLGELIARFHGLDAALADGIRASVYDLLRTADEHLREWLTKHYTDLSSLPVAKAPVMVSHIPRFLSMRRNAGETRIVLLVCDGLAIDQWVHIREHLTKQAKQWSFDENACFAWLPTLTSVSRQAIFSGLKPREFADTIDTTASEPNLWSRFWAGHGLRSNEVLYRKGIRRTEHLAELESSLNNSSIKIAGIVVDTIDEIVHGAGLGKRGISNQVVSWCESGFIDQLLMLLLDKGFHVYLTADHGNIEAVGQGRPNQGVAPELRGERVRTYRNEALAAESAMSNPNTFRLDIAGLPADFKLLFADNRTAFVPKGEQVVVHGGISVEELIVPFVKISNVS
ncbi:MAG: BREX-3 system phosphatase PglZ [Methylococcaceae bacterium]